MIRLRVRTHEDEKDDDPLRGVDVLDRDRVDQEIADSGIAEERSTRMLPLMTPPRAIPSAAICGNQALRMT